MNVNATDDALLGMIKQVAPEVRLMAACQDGEIYSDDPADHAFFDDERVARILRGSGISSQSTAERPFSSWTASWRSKLSRVAPWGDATASSSLSMMTGAAVLVSLLLNVVALLRSDEHVMLVGATTAVMVSAVVNLSCSRKMERLHRELAIAIHPVQGLQVDGHKDTGAISNEELADRRIKEVKKEVKQIIETLREMEIDHHLPHAEEVLKAGKEEAHHDRLIVSSLIMEACCAAATGSTAAVGTCASLLRLVEQKRSVPQSLQCPERDLWELHHDTHRAAAMLSMDQSSQVEPVLHRVAMGWLSIFVRIDHWVKWRGHR
jgi:hypothetical protein